MRSVNTIGHLTVDLSCLSLRSRDLLFPYLHLLLQSSVLCAHNFSDMKSHIALLAHPPDQLIYLLNLLPCTHILL